MNRILIQPAFRLSITAVLLSTLLCPWGQAGGQSAAPAASAAAPQTTGKAAAQAPGLPGIHKPISAENLTEREYSNAWPKPSFPSTEREKKQFTVEYVYRYAQSDYKPAVDVPQITHAQSQTDTPEHTFIAYISALKSGDYDWWLSLWDIRSQQMFRDEAVSKKQDAAYYKAQFQSQFGGKPVTLYSRLETVDDVLLEYFVGPKQVSRPAMLYPAPMRNEAGRWLLTRELQNFPFVPFLGSQTLRSSLDFVRIPPYSTQPVPPEAVQTQELFMRNQIRGADSATNFPW